MTIFATSLALSMFGSNQTEQYDKTALLALAHNAVIAEVDHLDTPSPNTTHQVKPVFVTIEIGGNVHGCRGSLDTRTQSLENEIILAARSAAAHDPRYRPLTHKQLANFRVTITIVESKRQTTDVGDLTPSEGLALQSGSKWGIVLPFEGKDPKIRLHWAYQKAKVPDGSPVRLFRLTAERF